MMLLKWLLLAVTAQALVTLFMYIPMSRARVSAVKKGTAQAADFRHPANTEPEETRNIAHALNNQFQLPLLFFVCTIAIAQTATVDWVLVALAWLFVVSKTVHSYLHATSNRLRHRRPSFMVAYFTAIAMWLWFGAKLVQL
jgi:hypothetical protein